MSFQQIDPKQIPENLIRLIADDWLLLSAGDRAAHNGMTVSWGGLGCLWGEPVATVYVRPQRYTDVFMQSGDTFSLCAFDASMHDMLVTAGSISGRGQNKSERLGLTPIFDEDGVYYEQARLVLLCQKLYADTIKPECFVNPALAEQNYPAKDFHTLYIGAIRKALVAQ